MDALLKRVWITRGGRGEREGTSRVGRGVVWGRLPAVRSRVASAAALRSIRLVMWWVLTGALG
jgi:hypothetical protein